MMSLLSSQCVPV
uniref:Uncharacterized protein n=1 Tax=Anguilla anguilla TaxID=7936 RepID=A0A0E9R9T4_ANGAN